MTLPLLSLSVASSIAISTPHYASAQRVLEGLEREQSSESVPGDQPADVGGPAPLNDTTAVEGGGNATNATMTGATNTTITGNENVTTAVGNQTGRPLDAITNSVRNLFDGGRRRPIELQCPPPFFTYSLNFLL